MVRFLKRRRSLEKSLEVTNMFETSERLARSMIIDNGGGRDNEKVMFRSQEAIMEQTNEGQFIGSVFDGYKNMIPISRFGRESACLNRQHPDIKQMKEKLSKLLLGEDMSGGGKGVSSVLALSNTITNLAASIFGEQHKLEPMSGENKCRWRREIDWFLSVTDHIVEFVPFQQVGMDGSKVEIMTAKQRKDLLMNIPALRKLDAMLLGYLDNFKDQNEFWYIERDQVQSEKGNALRKDDKWWLPIVKVPLNGLSEVSRKWLEFQKESVNQVLKASMAINAQVLMEMDIPEAYIESLPKNGKESLGDSLYHNITVEHFDPEYFLSSVDLSTEHKVLDVKNRIEASVVIWKRKMHNKNSKSWSSGVSFEKREQFEERAEAILHLIKHKYPGIPQSALDISKIQYNKDVGQSVLESYSRILETLAFTVMSMIEDVLLADQTAHDPSKKNSNRKLSLSDSERVPLKKLYSKEGIKKLDSMEPSMSVTLSDFMGWALDQDVECEKKQPGSAEDILDLDELTLKKPPNVITHKKISFIEKLENLGGLRSPAARR